MLLRKMILAATLSTLAAAIAACGVQVSKEETLVEAPKEVEVPKEDDGTNANTYGQAKQFLAEHTNVIELANDRGGRVIVCPEYQARVMTSSLDGDDGLSFGFICEDFINKGENSPTFNNYGGEERLWLSPEGGQFALWFKPGVKEQTLDDWRTPKDMNEGAWEVVSEKGASVVQMKRNMKLQNNSATEFDLNVTRDVHMLSDDDLTELFGEKAAEMLAAEDVKSVGYETVNTVTNEGEPMTMDKGLVSIWILGMFNSSPETVVIVPYISGDEAELGPVVCSDYFGELSAERLKVLPEAVLFLGDGGYRSKIGTSKRRSTDMLGSIDFENGVLTLVNFTMPEKPTEAAYMNNQWENPQEKPYDGDVINSYNDGPNDSGTQLGKFYELETLSPAKELKTGEQLVHKSRTLHIKADIETLKKLAKEVLGVDLDTVKKEMTSK